MMGVDRYVIFGGVIVVLVALLTLSVLTKGFGLTGTTAECQVCALTCENNTGNGGTVLEDLYKGIASIELTYGDTSPLGDANAPVVLVEISDYQCPYCERFYTNTEILIKASYITPGKAKLYFRDYPLGFHEHAMDAAIAARCAGEQDNYWGMHSTLFEKQGEWVASTDIKTTFSGYASTLGLNAETFSACFAARGPEAAINTDMAETASLGVRGTPGVFVVMPKDKLDMEKLNTGLTTLKTQYGPDVVTLYQDDDNVIAFVAGAYPFSVFDTIMKSVDY